jgi:hypothetical protein
MHTTCSTHLFHLDLIMRIMSTEEVPHYAIFSSLLSPNILLSALFSNILSLYYSTVLTPISYITVMF